MCRFPLPLPPLCSLLLLSSAGCATSAHAPRSGAVLRGEAAEQALAGERPRLAKALRSDAGGRLELTLDKQTGAVILLRASLPGNPAAGHDRKAALEAGRAFLDRHQALLDPRIDPAEYVPADEPDERGAATFERQVEGTRVLGSRITVRFSPEGRLVAVENAVASVPAVVEKYAPSRLRPAAEGGAPAAIDNKDIERLPPGPRVRSPFAAREPAAIEVLIPMVKKDRRFLQRARLLRWNDRPEAPSKGRSWVRIDAGEAGIVGPVLLHDPAPAAAPRYHVDARSPQPDFITYRPVGGVKVEKLDAEPNPAEIVYRFLEHHRSLFGTGAPRRQFRLVSVLEPGTLPGVRFVRVEQLYAGLPVFGAQLVFEIHDGDTVMSITGHVQPRPNEEVTARIGAAEAIAAAQRLARAAIQASTEPGGAALSARIDAFAPTAELGVFPGEIVADKTRKFATQLAYKVSLGEFIYFIGARDGAGLYAYATRASQDRVVQEGFGRGELARPTFVPVNVNGVALAPPGVTPNADVAGVAATLPTLSNLLGALGWSGLDGAGHRFVANTNVAIGSGCPNALFDSSLTDEAYFCLGVAPPDIVAHEFTHGVIAYSSGLVYQDEPGALNESYADVLGSAFFPDAIPPGAPPGTAPGWLMGEGVTPALGLTPCRPIAAYRNMAAPAAFCDAASVATYFGRNATPGGATTTCGLLPSSCDFGWVHSNSGITNLAHVLLAQGIAAGGGVAPAPGTPGALTAGITRPRLATLALLTVTTRLTPWARLLDAELSTHEMCETLRTRAGTGLDGTPFSLADCDQVPTAFRQVGLDADLVSGWAEPAMGFAGTDAWFTNAADVTTSGCNVTAVFEDLQTPSGTLRASFTAATAATVPVNYFGQFGVAISTPPTPGGSPAKRHNAGWFSIWGRKPTYAPKFAEAAPPAGQASCLAPAGTLPVQRTTVSTSHAGSVPYVGDKGDESVGPAASAMAPGCVLTATQVELVDDDDRVIQGPGSEVKEKVTIGSAFGQPLYAERGARVTTAPTAPPNLATQVHWWFEGGTSVRYRVRYFINQPAGVTCTP